MYTDATVVADFVFKRVTRQCIVRKLNAYRHVYKAMMSHVFAAFLSLSWKSMNKIDRFTGPPRVLYEIINFSKIDIFNILFLLLFK